MTYRVLGSPYTLVLHQHVSYLRLKRLPFKVYCRTFVSTLFHAFFLRARNTFCVVTPEGRSYLQMWQLLNAVESRGLQKDHAKILVNKRTHPNIHLATWIIFLYASWWLPKIGILYRWFGGEGVDVVAGYIRYFFFLPGFGFSRAIAGPFCRAMQKLVSVTGVSRETAPYMREHFKRFCAALEEHFKDNQDLSFILGTPHPTLADVAIAAVFSANFLMDNTPASTLLHECPYLNRYLEAVTGWRGDIFVDTDKTKTEKLTSLVHNSSTDTYADVVPETLLKLFQLIEEVMPFMLSQCAAFHAFMAGDGVRRLRKESLEGEWKGCSGYLLSQITDIKSLMIVDNGIYTINALAQDLEVALLAAREVAENDDYDAECIGITDDTTKLSLGVLCEGETRTAVNLTSTNRLSLDNVDSTPEAVMSLRKSPGPVRSEERSAGGTLAEEADFHRVFTTAASRARGVLRSRCSLGKFGRDTLDDCLRGLRDMLCDMHHPHYTLSSVFHGRKMFVAVIPECDVAGKKLFDKRSME